MRPAGQVELLADRLRRQSTLGCAHTGAHRSVCSSSIEVLGYAGQRSTKNPDSSQLHSASRVSAALRRNRSSSSATAKNFNRRLTQRSSGPMCLSKKSLLHLSVCATSPAAHSTPRRIGSAQQNLVLLAAGALGLAGCGGGADEQVSEQTSDELIVNLDAQGDFKAPGLRATLDAQGATRTRVMVDGLDEGERAGGGANPAHVHRGTCEEPIAAGTYEIGQLEGPVAETIIDVPISDLVGGGYVVEVHLPPVDGRAGPGEAGMKRRAGRTRTGASAGQHLHVAIDDLVVRRRSLL